MEMELRTSGPDTAKRRSGASPGCSQSFHNRLPFSSRLEPEREAMWRLAETFGLGEQAASTRLIRGSGADGLLLERYFRLSWWNAGTEPLRAAQHRAKTQIHSLARARGEWTTLTRAWRAAEREVHSRTWRRWLHDFCAGEAPTERAYLRLAFRAAQQVWSHAARWRAALPDEPERPFEWMAELLAGGIWPLGCAGGSLWFFAWDRTVPKQGDWSAEVGPLAGPQAGLAETMPTGLFLSSPFQQAALSERWEGFLREQGWRALHGPVDEQVAPAEVQLGERIRGARAVIGLIDRLDADFGLPWWMYQELDYASALKKPTVLLSSSCPEEAPLVGLDTIRCAPGTANGRQAERALRRWLEVNVPDAE